MKEKKTQNSLEKFIHKNTHAHMFIYAAIGRQARKLKQNPAKQSTAKYSFNFTKKRYSNKNNNNNLYSYCSYLYSLNNKQQKKKTFENKILLFLFFVFSSLCTCVQMYQKQYGTKILTNKPKKTKKKNKNSPNFFGIEEK